MKNIKTCAIVAKSQREKVKKAIELRNTGYFTTQAAMNSSIDMGKPLDAKKPEGLRKRLMQIRRNR